MNRYRPHVFVLPEDDANRQLANGFLLHPDLTKSIQVLPVAGGWTHVLSSFAEEYVPQMYFYSSRFMIMLIDFDNSEERLDYAKSKIPEPLRDRVFLLGASGEPEQLRKALSHTYEQIGLDLARDCRNGTDAVWSHPLLQHNSVEVDRLRRHVRPILFPSANE